MSRLSDVHPDIEAKQIELLRETPIWRKLEMLRQLNQMAYAIAMSGLRQRHPDAGEAELRRRMAGLLLGEELAEKAYRPLPEAGGDADENSP